MLTIVRIEVHRYVTKYLRQNIFPCVATSSTEESPVSRVQLALNVSDIDEAIAFYSKMFTMESKDACCATSSPVESVSLTTKPGCC